MPPAWLKPEWHVVPACLPVSGKAGRWAAWQLRGLRRHSRAGGSNWGAAAHTPPPPGTVILSLQRSPPHQTHDPPLLASISNYVWPTLFISALLLSRTVNLATRIRICMLTRGFPPLPPPTLLACMCVRAGGRAGGQPYHPCRIPLLACICICVKAAVAAATQAAPVTLPHKAMRAHFRGSGNLYRSRHSPPIHAHAYACRLPW